MAEFLIKAVDASHPDPAKDRTGCYKRGDVVAVAPDGHRWGRDEALPKFLVVRVPGLPVERARRYTEPLYDPLDASPESRVMRRRRYRFDFMRRLGAGMMDAVGKSEWLVPEISEAFIEDKTGRTG
ncbi:MAG TPA: hypothetical protein ENJ37_03880 [Deltaproteobacteria bacterium]|nr:hypothetical protein [Deltaproteobacteria bacterium]